MMSDDRFYAKAEVKPGKGFSKDDAKRAQEKLDAKAAEAEKRK